MMTLLFRAYSDSSAGSLKSGKGAGDGRHLSPAELLDEFENHRHQDQRKPTALVSVTVSIVRALRRAFNKLYYDEEKADMIKVVIIQLPMSSEIKIHSAETLASGLGLTEAFIYRDEYLFEWKIPKVAVCHQVSVQTLIARGLDWKVYCESEAGDLPSTKELRNILSRVMFNPLHDGYESGFNLGWFARCFGARAPVRDIAYALRSDCTPIRRIYDASDVAMSHLGHIAHVSCDYFVNLDAGLKEALYEWWLNNVDFILDYAEHIEWAAHRRAEFEKLRDSSIGIHLLEDIESATHQDIERSATQIGL